MIIAVEGVSAAGKTSWAERYAPVVVDDICGAPPPGDNASVGRYWSERHAERWQRGLELENQHGRVCFDADPLKIHYAWCLWQIGAGDRDVWIATVNVTREAILQQRIGFADQIAFLEPQEQVVRLQKIADTSRRRSNFELHVRLGPALRRWYEILEELSAGRIGWHANLPGRWREGRPRTDRYSIELFDAFIAAADQGA